MPSLSGYAVGVDLFRGRWLAATWPIEGVRKPRFDLLSKLSDVATAFPDASVIAVDIPIGLGVDGARRADGLAAAFIGGRRFSVFAMPPRHVLEADTHALAVELAREMGVGAPSIQAFGLRASLFEAELLAAGDERVIEIHPEVSFCAMSGRPLTHSKKSWNGAMERIRLLGASGCGIQSHIGEAGVTGVDDVLDACAAAWSAERYRRGEAISLPAPPEQLAGRSVAIWY